MARNGSGVYSAPAGTFASPQTEIESAKYNAFVQDVVNDLNLPRPVVAGGTGASTAVAARENLGLEIGVDIPELEQWRDNLVALLADTAMTYTAGLSGSVVSGDYVRTRSEGFSYKVAASAATNHDLVTAGGVKLYSEKAAPLPYMPADTFERVKLDNGPIYVWLMGQSNAEGASPTTTGAVFAANANVTVWRESTSTFITPTVSQEPFNASGSNNAGLDFCNKLAEETGRPVRMVLIATGSTAISAWTGSTGNRTVSVGNRPRYVEMLAARTAIGRGADVFLWIQGEANGADSVEYYVSEFAYLLSQMTADAVLGANTPVIVSQLSQGVRGEKGNGASSNAVLANANIYGLLSLGDDRLRVANSLGLAVQAGELTEGTQGASVHFTDQGLRDLGRKRMWSAYVQALDGFNAPVDFGLEVSRTDTGLIGSHLFGGGTVDTTIANATALPIAKLGQLIDVLNTKTLTLPDFTHPTRYSSGVKNRVGLCVYFRLTQVGSCTINIESGGTGGLVRQGSIYAAGALETSFTISAAGASTANIIHMARWTGARWDVTRITN